MSQSTSRLRSARAVLLAACVAAALCLSVADAVAQGWGGLVAVVAARAAAGAARAGLPPAFGPDATRANAAGTDAAWAGPARPAAVAGAISAGPGARTAGTRTGLRPAQQYLPCSSSAAGGGDAGRQPDRDCCPGSRTTCASWTATTRRRSSSSTAPTAGTSSCSPRRSAHAALRPAGNGEVEAIGGGSPTSRLSAARSWARATARSRTTSSASSPATAAASSTRRRRAGATARNPFSTLWGEEEGESSARQPQPVRQSALRHLPHAVRAAVRRLLLPGKLLDAA